MADDQAHDGIVNLWCAECHASVPHRGTVVVAGKQPIVRITRAALAAHRNTHTNPKGTRT